jgi:hypothetical protein
MSQASSPSGNKTEEDDMRTFASTLLALSFLTGVAGQVYAQTEDPNPNDTKQFYEQLDRENRGGNAGQ